MLNRNRNACEKRHQTTNIPASRMSRSIAKVLQQEGFISEIAEEGEGGRIVTEEASLHASNVMIYSTAKKVASRVEIVVDKDGNKKRKLKKTGELLD